MKDGLYTRKEAAAYLTISTKTLDRHVQAGEIWYIDKGRGTKRKSVAFAKSDLDAFEEARRRRAIPEKPEPKRCPSTGRRGGKNTSMTSGSTVIDFMDLLAARGERL